MTETLTRKGNLWVESDGTYFTETGGFEEEKGRNFLECHKEQRPQDPASFILLFFSHWSCARLWDPRDCSTAGFPVLHYLSQFAQTHVKMSLSQWCHPTISSSVARFSSCPQSVPESGSFPMSWLFTSGGQSVGPWERYKKSTVKTVKFPLNKLTQSRGWRLGQFFLVTNWVPEGTAGGLGAEKDGRTVRLESAHCFVEAGFLGGDALGVLGFWWCVCVLRGFPGGTSGKEPACQCRGHKRLGFDPWVGKIPWSKAWKPTPCWKSWTYVEATINWKAGWLDWSWYAWGKVSLQLGAGLPQTL